MHPILFSFDTSVHPVPHALLTLPILVAALVCFAWAVRRHRFRAALVGGLITLGVAYVAWKERSGSWPWGVLRLESFGASLALAALLAGWLFQSLVSRQKLAQKNSISVLSLVGIGALVGARLTYVLASPSMWPDPSRWLNLQQGGLSGYGALLGGAAALAVSSRRHGGLARWGDAMAPSFGLFVAISKLGCYAFGCGYGRRLASDAPAWLRSLGTFPRWEGNELLLGSGSPAWQRHVLDYGLSIDSPRSLAVHPVQLYESMLGLLLLGAGLWLSARRRFPGQVMLVTVVGYGLGRLLLELFRGDPERGLLGALFAQGFATLLLAAIVVVVLETRALEGRWGTSRYPKWTRVGLLLFVVALALAIQTSPQGGIFTPLSLSQCLGAATALAAAWIWPRWAQNRRIGPRFTPSGDG